jgi:hypothetical protein
MTRMGSRFQDIRRSNVNQRRLPHCHFFGSPTLEPDGAEPNYFLILLRIELNIKPLLLRDNWLRRSLEVQ